MTTYKEIYGTNVEVLGSDPSNPVEGQIWYNSTSQTLKGYALVAGSWATAGPLNTARWDFATGVGTQTAALATAGRNPPSTTLSATELYNGTSWTSNPTGVNTTRGSAGQAGTQTAALMFGGQTQPAFTPNSATESWNGSTWTTNPATLNTSRGGCGSAGTQTAALAFGGYATASSVATESWNGTS